MVNRQPKGIPIGGQFAENQHAEQESSLDRLATMEPHEVDEEIAEIYIGVNRIESQIAGHRADIRRFEKWARSGAYSERYTSSGIEHAEGKIAELEEQKAPLIAEFQVREDEYLRRGGWTRAFLVRGSDGHIHSSRECSTCFPTTQYAWLPQVSGKDEDEIVDLAGERACTVCYPSAPVETLSKPSRLEDPEVAAARAERDAKKAADAAKKAEKAIASPDGTPLRIRGSLGLETIQTEYAAKQELGGEIYLAAEGPDADEDEIERRSEYGRNADLIVEALAAKHGTTPEEEVAEAMKRLRRSKSNAYYAKRADDAGGKLAGSKYDWR